MKGRYYYEDGGTVVHVLFKGTPKQRQLEVPVKRAVWIDPSAGRYAVIDGKMRRVDRPGARRAPMPHITVRRAA